MIVRISMGQNKTIKTSWSTLGGISRDEKSYRVATDGSLAVRMYEGKCVSETR
jgi:hypothetical protein